VTRRAIRYVIANWTRPAGIHQARIESVTVLPDAEHIHVHIRDDGTITAVPMEPVELGHRDYCYAVVDGGTCTCDFPFRSATWVDTEETE
jgi:hypothetical protein